MWRLWAMWGKEEQKISWTEGKFYELSALYTKTTPSTVDHFHNPIEKWGASNQINVCVFPTNTHILNYISEKFGYIILVFECMAFHSSVCWLTCTKTYCSLIRWTVCVFSLLIHFSNTGCLTERSAYFRYSSANNYILRLFSLFSSHSHTHTRWTEHFIPLHVRCKISYRMCNVFLFNFSFSSSL